MFLLLIRRFSCILLVYLGCISKDNLFTYLKKKVVNISGYIKAVDLHPTGQSFFDQQSILLHKICFLVFDPPSLFFHGMFSVVK
jgi:hypothetical protein